MAEVKRGERRETSAADDATVVAPRFDEREAATARPVVPLGGSNNAGRWGSGGFSWRANSRQLLLAWAVMATLAAGGVALYKSADTSEPQIAPQPVIESTAGGAVAATPETSRRAVPIAPSRAAKMTEVRNQSPSWEVPDWSNRGDVKRDDGADEEELDERARKEEKRRRKEEKKRREEAEEEAEEAKEELERARKAARKQAERQRERQKDDGRKARLVGVLTGQD